MQLEHVSREDQCNIIFKTEKYCRSKVGLNFSYKKLTQPFLLISGGVAYFSENWKPKFSLNSVSKPLLFSCKMCSFLRQNFFGGFLRTWLTTCDNSSSRATKELSISNPFHLHNYFCQHFISLGQWLWLS